MDRSRKGNPPSSVLAFRIPERTEAPPANASSAAAWTCATCPESEGCALVEPCERHEVVAFPKPKATRRQVDHRAEAARLFDDAIRLRREARKARV